MLMRGDMNKILEEVNKVLDTAFNRISALEDRIAALEAPKTTTKRAPAAKKEES